MKNSDLEIVYKMYYKQLLLYAFGLTKNYYDAQDLVSTTMVKAALSFENGSIQAWLYKVLQNEFYMFCRKQKKIIYIEDIEQKLTFDCLIIEKLIKEEQQIWLYHHILKLDEVKRNIMILSLYSILDDHEIAVQLNLSIENIRTLRHRAKHILIKMNKEEIKNGR